MITVIELTTRIGKKVYINLEAIDAIYGEGSVEYNVVLRSQITYSLDKESYLKLMKVLHEGKDL